MIANLVTLALSEKSPTSYAAMLVHPERAGYEASLEDECQSYWDNLAVIEEPSNFDWSTIDKDQMGDLMIIFSKKKLADGTFEKYKCRIVFRGDRWKNTNVVLFFVVIAGKMHFDLVLIPARWKKMPSSLWLQLQPLKISTCLRSMSRPHFFMGYFLKAWCNGCAVLTDFRHLFYRASSALENVLTVTRSLDRDGMSIVMPLFAELALLRLFRRRQSTCWSKIMSVLYSGNVPMIFYACVHMVRL
jgi:hypothetical protein